MIFTLRVSPIMPQPQLACYSPAIVNNITKPGTLPLSVHASPALGVFGGCWTLSQLSWCEGRVTPGVQAWTSCQFIAETKAPTLTVSPRDNLELPISLMCMSPDCAREPENLEGTHAGTTSTAHTKVPALNSTCDFLALRQQQ